MVVYLYALAQNSKDKPEGWVTILASLVVRVTTALLVLNYLSLKKKENTTSLTISWFFFFP